LRRSHHAGSDAPAEASCSTISAPIIWFMLAFNWNVPTSVFDPLLVSHANTLFWTPVPSERQWVPREADALCCFSAAGRERQGEERECGDGDNWIAHHGSS
jgi:hypothetical protein